MVLHLVWRKAKDCLLRMANYYLLMDRLNDRMDRTEIFLHPVNKAQVPDYFDVITEPMCWLFIDDKLEKNGYLHVEDFIVSVGMNVKTRNWANQE